MKKLILSVVLCFFTATLTAGYNETVSQAVSAYKAKDWIKAAGLFKKAYGIKKDPKIKKYYNFCVKNGYKENIGKGNGAYKKGDMESALRYYTAANTLYPNDKLKKIINNISLKYGLKADAPAMESVSGGKADNPLKWALIGGDVLLAGLSTWLFLDQGSAAGEYNTLYDEINNTTAENYDLLVERKSEVEGKQSLFAVTSVLAVAAIGYTLADMFALKILFNDSVAAGYDPESEQYKLALNMKF